LVEAPSAIEPVLDAYVPAGCTVGLLLSGVAT